MDDPKSIARAAAADAMRIVVETMRLPGRNAATAIAAATLVLRMAGALSEASSSDGESAATLPAGVPPPPPADAPESAWAAWREAAREAGWNPGGST